jgi:hypothetical protein
MGAGGGFALELLLENFSWDDDAFCVHLPLIRLEGKLPQNRSLSCLLS